MTSCRSSCSSSLRFEMPEPAPQVIRLGDVDPATVDSLLGGYDLSLEWVPGGAPIPASYWGEPEAGIAGQTVFARADTPVHSLLHEAAHVICMTPARRIALHRDAGGSDLEESAVCYLQILLADRLPGVGSERLMNDMDAWGYSFRLGSTARWFAEDAGDAVAFLRRHRILDDAGRLTGHCRGELRPAC